MSFDFQPLFLFAGEVITHTWVFVLCRLLLS